MLHVLAFAALLLSALTSNVPVVSTSELSVLEGAALSSGMAGILVVPAFVSNIVDESRSIEAAKSTDEVLAVGACICLDERVNMLFMPSLERFTGAAGDGGGIGNAGLPQRAEAVCKPGRIEAVCSRLRTVAACSAVTVALQGSTMRTLPRMQKWGPARWYVCRSTARHGNQLWFNSHGT